MATHRERFSSGGSLIESKQCDRIFVFDRRKGDSAEVSLQFDGLNNFKSLLDKLHQVKHTCLLCFEDWRRMRRAVGSGVDESEKGATSIQTFNFNELMFSH